MTEISGKAAVVTGGGSGIGMGLAKELARQGASIAVADILLENARRVADEINSSGGKAVAVHCDVSDRKSVQQMKAEANAALGPIDLLFANAGACSFEPLMVMSDDEVDWIIQVCLMGVVHTTRAFLPDMVAARGGHITATSSTAGLFPSWAPLHVPYSAAKAGIIGLIMNLAVEVAEYDIGTTIYCPGGVASGMKDNNSRYRPERFGGPIDRGINYGEANKEQSALNFYRPDDIAPMVLNAVRKNRPFVFDHAEQRVHFRDTYSSVVESCYDDSERWERENGVPEPNPDGPRLVLS